LLEQESMDWMRQVLFTKGSWKDYIAKIAKVSEKDAVGQMENFCHR